MTEKTKKVVGYALGLTALGAIVIAVMKAGEKTAAAATLPAGGSTSTTTTTTDKKTTTTTTVPPKTPWWFNPILPQPLPPSKLPQ